MKFFHADNVGLPMSYLEQGSAAFIRAIISLCEIDTESLIDLYNCTVSTEVKEAKDTPIEITEAHILNVLTSRTEDKVAQRFVAKCAKTPKKSPPAVSRHHQMDL